MKFLIAFVTLLIATSAAAHSGGTDAFGCHKDHRTGIVHCH